MPFLQSKKGSVSEVVPKAWFFVWEWFKTSNMKRAFSGDFELYDSRSVNPNDAEIDIYIAIK
jgi:predicted transcriptional regulator YdeE